MSFKPRSAKVPLYSGDYQQRVDLIDAEIQATKQAAERARKSNQVRLLSELPPGAFEDARVAELEAEREALVTEAEANGEVTIATLQALAAKDGVPGRKRWADLIKAHPPREGDDVPEATREADKRLGVNDEAFGEALVPLSIVALEPDMPVDDLLDNLSSAQFDLLYAVAFGLNRGTGSDPKALRTKPSLSSPETEPSPAA